MTIKGQNQSVTERTPQKWRVATVITEGLFLLTGVFLTLVAHLFLSVYVDQMIRTEYEQTTENTVTTMAKEFSSIERSLSTVAMLMGASAESDESLFQKTTVFDPTLKNFEQVIMLVRGADKKWQYKSLYANPEKIYNLKVNSKLLAGVQNTLNNNVAQLLVDPALFEMKEAGPVANVDARPFALFHPVYEDGTLQGVLIGVNHAGTFLNERWKVENNRILKLTIRDANTDQNIFNLERKDKGEKLQGARRMYEFEFGGHRIEVRTDYATEQKVLVLTTLPYFAIFFGFVLTTAGTLYIHGSQRHALRISAINRELEDKNRELQLEMTKRQQLRNVFKKTEDENKSLIDSVSDIIFETDMAGKILFLNATWQKITGFSIEQSRGLDLFNMLHPQDQEKQRKDFHALMQGQKAPYRSFTRLRMSDGSFRAVDLSISMIRQDEGQNHRVVGALTDVEERRRAERALSEAEKKYRTIVENAAGGIFQLTPEGIYLSANPAMARILGYHDPDDLLENVKNASEQVYFNARERLYFMKELENTGFINNYETQVVRKDGTRVWVNENVHAVKDDSGVTLYYEGSLEDISQRKEAEIVLKETKIHSDLANRAKSEFIANMSHELRTPLNSIIGFSEIIKNETFGPMGQNAYKEYANDIHISGKKLLSVINEILDISKIEAGDRHLNDQIVDLDSLMESTIKLLDNKAKNNNLVVLNQMKDVPKIVGEQLALKQVMTNLLSNAIKFTPSGGRVTITNEIDARGDLRISITDTGIGLDESEVEKALSPFGQIHSEFSRNNAGTGLGLTLADALVKLHDGKLELFSQKGIGTTVSIVFPKDRVSQQKNSQGVNPRSEKQT
jgi:PAS domain S-box-containing protein